MVYLIFVDNKLSKYGPLAMPCSRKPYLVVSLLQGNLLFYSMN